MSTFPPFTTILGTQLIETQSLAGCKRAVQIGNGPIHVSPAMMSLILGAESDDEIRRILGAIKVLRLPKSANINDLSGYISTDPA